MDSLHRCRTTRTRCPLQHYQHGEQSAVKSNLENPVGEIVQLDAARTTSPALRFVVPAAPNATPAAPVSSISFRRNERKKKGTRSENLPGFVHGILAHQAKNVPHGPYVHSRVHLVCKTPDLKLTDFLSSRFRRDPVAPANHTKLHFDRGVVRSCVAKSCFQYGNPRNGEA